MASFTWNRRRYSQTGERSCDPGDYKNYLRMDLATFEELVTRLTPSLEKKETVMRRAISPAEQLAATLRFLPLANRTPASSINSGSASQRAAALTPWRLLAWTKSLLASFIYLNPRPQPRSQALSSGYGARTSDSLMKAGPPVVSSIQPQPQKLPPPPPPPPPVDR